ncbi:MAG: M20/M25/M40 family metallo-hydrolase, partial [Planctomycetota bacterium]|nr:M20/M25/M40 family metallo-hydrolase [Planctomycetota bacterium]
MAIPGRSGQEGRVVEFVKRSLLRAGVAPGAISTDTAHRKSPIGGECGNLIVKLPGTVRKPRRLLMAHLDTVPLCVGSRPVRHGDRILPKDGSTGLGGDDRAGVAVVLGTALAILDRGLPHPPLTLFFPVQEEIGLVGARFASVGKLGRPALCFNWDGGEPSRVIHGATGASAIEILIRGIASHAGVHPEEGVSAAVIAAKAIADLDRNGWHGLVRKLGMTGTSNVGAVAGGEATNVVMPALRLRAEARSHDPGFRARIIDECRAAFTSAADETTNVRGQSGSVEFVSELRYESFRLATDSIVVETAAAAAVRRAGFTP